MLGIGGSVTSASATLPAPPSGQQVGDLLGVGSPGQGHPSWLDREGSEDGKGSQNRVRSPARA